MKSFTIILLSSITAFSAFSQTEAPVEQPQSGYYGRISAGVLAGNSVSTSLQISNGYRFKHLEVGIGLGSERHITGRYIPLFLESRYNFGKGNTQPFVGIMAGYSAAVNRYNTPSNGIHFTAGLNIGLTHYFTRHFGMSTVIGYRFTRTDGYVYDIWNYYNNTQDMQQLEVRIGMVFR